MIEIKDGWSLEETNTQYKTSALTSEINNLNKKLERALENRAQLQSRCNHKHVLFAGQNMTCEVCGAALSS